MTTRRRSPTARARRPASLVGSLTVGQTARILSVSASTLRMWENVGLITPARHGRQRRYSPELLDVLKRIKYLRDVQRLNLPGIRQALGRRSGRARDALAAARQPTDVGDRLRRLRKRAGLRLVEAARRASISPGFLSAVELSRANPSVATLQRLAAAYDTTVLEFYDVPSRKQRLVRPADRRALQADSGVRLELLSVGTHLESMLFRLAPGAGSGGSYSHEGEEFVYVMAGTVEFWLDELECHVLHEGDSFWFESTVGHRWYNPGTTEAVLLWINTPPTF